MTPERPPPRLARWLLELALPPDVRESVCGDLEEVFQRRRHSHGRMRARFWFVKEAMLMSSRFIWERIRERGSRTRKRETTESSAGFRKRSLLAGGPSWLDFKLGLRMLARYPGLTLVGVLSMSVGVGLGAAYFEVANDLAPSLPLEDGDRIVGIENWDLDASGPRPRSLHDFALWRDELRSIEELGAFTLTERNLIVEDGGARPVRGAEITAAAFRVARVPPLLGRTLIEADEQEGAPSAVVIGHTVWQNRFSADLDVVGRTVRLGSTDHTVVGVMPEDFAFPMNQHFWIPLRANPTSYERGQGPAIQVFGRLAAGVTLEEAQAELTTIGNRAAEDFPDTNEHLRPRVVPYTQLFYGGGNAREPTIELILVLILVGVSVNVGTLVFARTAARANEMAVRHALGASRGRIVVQLSIEILVLAMLGAAVGLVAGGWGVNWALGLFWRVVEGEAPFWWDNGLALATAVYATGLALLGAIMAGLLPALRATGRSVQGRLRHAADVNGSSFRLGGIWTVVIVTQVAFSVATLPLAIGFVWSWIQSDTKVAELGFPAEEYLSVRLVTHSETAPGDKAASADLLSEFQATYQELGRRLEADPAVAGVTFANRLPGMVHTTRQVEVAGIAPPDDPALSAQELYGHEVETAAVDPRFFDVLRTPILSGRAFISGDVAPEQRVVIVNEAFVNEVLGGRNAVGQQVRYVQAPGEEPGAWQEIIGVARDLGTERSWIGLVAQMRPALYHPLGGEPDAFRGRRLGTAVADGSDTAHTIRMALHLRGEPEAFGPALRRSAADLDPDLRLYDLLPLTGLVDQLSRVNQLINLLFASAFAAVALIALLISSAGTYALMSFAVTRRAREIAIRAALGARPRRILAVIFSRAFIQIGGGVLVGILPSAVLVFLSLGQVDEAYQEWLIPLLTIVAVMIGVGVLACGVPARRALRIQPSEAMKDVG